MSNETRPSVSNEELFTGAERYKRKTFERSSVVHFVSYDSLTRVLSVVFKNGSTYEYYGVDDETVNEFMNSQSLGRYLNFVLKKFKQERIR